MGFEFKFLYISFLVFMLFNRVGPFGTGWGESSETIAPVPMVQPDISLSQCHSTSTLKIFSGMHHQRHTYKNCIFSRLWSWWPGDRHFVYRKCSLEKWNHSWNHAIIMVEYSFLSVKGVLCDTVWFCCLQIKSMMCWAWCAALSVLHDFGTQIDKNILR